jgi:hypothetical protein
MDNRRSTSRRHIIITSVFLAATGLFAGAPLHAQQQPSNLSAPFAKAALSALIAIQSDTSAPQDKSGDPTAVSATLRSIEIAYKEAFSAQEESLTEILQRAYRVRLHDNDVMRAYGKLIEINGADDLSDGPNERRGKDAAMAQYADAEAVIEKREEACFHQLEQSFLQRSQEDTSACSEWFQKEKASGKPSIKLGDN